MIRREPIEAWRDWNAARRRRFGGMSTLLLTAAFLMARPSFAQEVHASASLDEVVVTARRVTEKLEDVPLAITALSAATLERAGATDLRGILEQTPGVTLFGSASEAVETPVIRGQFDLNNSAFTDGQPNVAVFMDGVYLQNSNAVSIGLLGLDRVEVVKGPVSALYGRNGFAGAINYVSKLPTDSLHADVLARFGEYGTENLMGDVSGPIAPGILRVGFAYNYQDSDGPYRDSVDGLRAGGFRKKDAKFSFDFTPLERLDINGGIYYGQDHFDVDALTVATPNCIPVDGIFTEQCGKFVANPIQVAPIPASSGNSGNNRTVTAAHLKVNYDVSFADLSYLAGYNRVAQRSYEDFVGLRDGLTYQLSPGPGTVQAFNLFGSDDNTEDSSHELRITSKQNQPLRWAAGGDYFQSTLYTTTRTGEDGANIPAGQSIITIGFPPLAEPFVTPTGSPSTLYYTAAEIREKNYSAFGSLEYDILAPLTVGGEIRTTRDEQRMDIITNNIDSIFSGLGGGPVPLFEPFGPIPPARFDYSDWRAFLKYKITPDMMAYASVATGTKAGGFNTQSSLVTNQTYGPETNKTYEVGLKSFFFAKTLEVDAAIYHIDSRGLQLYFPEGDGIHSVIENLGGTTNTGFELSALVKPLPRLTVFGSVAYTDPKFNAGTYDTTDVGVCLALATCASRVTTITVGGHASQAINIQGLMLPAASKLTFNLSGDYTVPLSDGLDAFLHADFRYQDKQFDTITYVNSSFTGATDLLNLRVGMHRGPFTVAVYVQNVLNDQTPLNVAQDTELNNLGHEFVGDLSNPRIYGGEIQFHY